MFEGKGEPEKLDNLEFTGSRHQGDFKYCHARSFDPFSTVLGTARLY